MKTFNERTHDRKTRVKACKWFVEETEGLLPLEEHRSQLLRIKKDMLAGKPPKLSRFLKGKVVEKKAEKSKSLRSKAAKERKKGDTDIFAVSH